MNAVVEDLLDILVQGGVGTFAGQNEKGWALYLHAEPDAPVQVVTLYETPGRVERGLAKTGDFFHSGFQVRCRAFVAEEVRDKLLEVQELLDRCDPFDVEGTHYSGVDLPGEPLYLTTDEKGRQVWVLNGVAHRSVANT